MLCYGKLSQSADIPIVLQARCQLGNKYGALQEDYAGLLSIAKQLGIKVVGVAFHVGSGATNPHAFADAIAAARLVGALFSHAVLQKYELYFLPNCVAAPSLALGTT